MTNATQTQPLTRSQVRALEFVTTALEVETSLYAAHVAEAKIALAILNGNHCTHYYADPDGNERQVHTHDES